MAEERNVGLARASDSADDDVDQTKAALQRRMEEARESITQTVTEIKDTVVNQYQQVKENISETLDWREQFRRRPIPFTVGAFAAGALVGYAVMGAFKGDGDDEEDYEGQDSFDRIEAGYDRGIPRSYAAQPVLGKSAGAYQRTGRPESNASTESAEVFGRGGYEQSQDVGPDTRPSYSSGYQAPTAPAPQALVSQASSSAATAEEEEPKGPGLFERFKETKAYDKLQEELSTLGERALEELSKTARNVVVPALLNKLKGMIGLDLSAQGGAQQGGGQRRQSAGASQPAQTAYSGGASGQTAPTGQTGQTTQGAGTSDTANTSARAASGGTEGYGAS
ncbi:MAG TPA: hypothetical protein VJ866_19610 [Pyrinomonadaceae bacterium]|nr:hypothetical protein [Pyrinomonadaceae bacterium]